MDTKKAPQGFTEEFKTEALHQLTEQGQPQSSVSESAYPQNLWITR